MLLKKHRTVNDRLFQRIIIHKGLDDYNMCKYCNFYNCNTNDLLKCEKANFNALLYNRKYSIVYVAKKDRKD